MGRTRFFVLRSINLQNIDKSVEQGALRGGEMGGGFFWCGGMKVSVFAPPTACVLCCASFGHHIFWLCRTGGASSSSSRRRSRCSVSLQVCGPHRHTMR